VGLSPILARRLEAGFVLYTVSKVFWLIVQPAHLWILLMVIGTALLFTRRRRIGLGLLSLDGLLILMIALLPVGHWFITPLEDRFPRLVEMPIHVDGIIMLGGDADVAFADLARRYPKAKLVFTGAAPPQEYGVFYKVNGARHSSQWMGIETSRITFSPESRNTFEDVVDAKAIVHPTPTEIWILVTSAFHMPRSVGLFQAQDWRVVPNPVGYRAGAGDVAISNLDFAQNLTLLSLALKEWIGMFANRLLGHSESLFPGPPSELLRKASQPLAISGGSVCRMRGAEAPESDQKRRDASRGEFTSHC
jgi:uncharacterized SAM-binding protein YcdF (DUF218 family)